MEKKKYNLRSFKSDGVQAPLQMHMSEDHIFLTNSLGNSSAHAQQDSDPNSSGIDLDGSALVNSSDSDDAGTNHGPLIDLPLKVPVLLLTNTRPLILRPSLIKLFCSICLPLVNG